MRVTEGTDHAALWAEEMEQIHRAAAAYYRDFKRWPDTVDAMSGSLPPRFALSRQLTYRPVPQFASNSFDWVLIVSEPVQLDRSGNALDMPHRLVLLLNGKVELLPVAEVEAQLGTQPAEVLAPLPVAGFDNEPE